MVKFLLTAILITGFFSSLSSAATPDRIVSQISSDQMVALKGNMHGLAKPEFDLGRADGGRLIQGVSLAFRPSAAQQKALDLLMSQLQDRSSPNYHKFLTPSQFADRFGMSRNDVNKIVAWLKSEGFTNISVANSRNQISFDGTVAQIESVFRVEMHNYLVNGEVHMANANEPSVPAALAGAVLAIGHLNDFAPKPRVKVRPNLTSYLSGSHFLSPDDFATIYDLNALYSAGSDGTGQKIAVVGESTVNTTDLSNFRSAAGLPASTVTMTLMEGTATRCSGDELESDLDLEWSGGVAKNASIIFVYAGLGSGDTCTSRYDSVWDALQYAVDNKVAPFISTSYGYCESGLGQSNVQTIQGWAQQGITQGQTIVAASGDSGAADCDPDTSTSATHGLAVDVPASIPEVTGAGGTEFTGDSAGTVSGNQAAAAPPYWSGSGAGSDTVSSALEYIPEEAWNDTAAYGSLAASGGGASIYFTKPTWQTGTGVPADGARDVPDVALNASPMHDPYLICSEDDEQTGGTVSTCTSGFRTGSGGDFTAVGGTSADAPTFSAILALINQYLGNTPPTGLAPINPTLYFLAAQYPSAFHDVTTGNNKVPCTTGTTDCPSGTTEIGFSAGTGYDQVTGWGSVDGFVLAQAWAASQVSFTTSATALSPASVSAGNSATSTVTITPGNTYSGTLTYTLSCPSAPTGVTCSFNPTTVNSSGWSSALTVSTSPTMATGNISVTVAGTAGGVSESASPLSLTVTATTESYTLNSNLGSGGLQVTQGSQGIATFTVASTTGFVTGTQTAVPVTYTCSDPASESTCTGPSGPTTATSVSFTITTTAPSASLQRPFDRTRIFYAALLPGLLGIMLTFGSRKRSLRGMRVLGLIMVLGFSTLWLGSCGGNNSSSSNPGTPVGQYTITISATTGGSSPIAPSNAPVTFTLNVVQ
jgi:hypothetical protein